MYRIRNVNVCARVSWRPTRNDMYDTRDELDERGGKAGGVQWARVALKCLRREMPTSGLIRYMTKKRKVAQRSAQGNTDNPHGWAVAKLRWLFAAWTCASGGGPIQLQTRRIRPIRVNRIPSALGVQIGESPVWTPRADKMFNVTVDDI